MADVFCPHCMQSISTVDTQFCPTCGYEIDLRSEAHQIPIGTVLRGNHGHTYLFGEVKGEGGFGMTYIAKEMNSGTVVAIKEYFPIRCQVQRMPDLSVQPSGQMREMYLHGIKSFLSEASMLRAVQDVKSIVRVLDYFEANNTAYMIMEYLNGTTLSRLMETQSHFEPSLLLRKFLPLMRDLGRIHDAGVLHRDIAPDNVMLMPDGSLKLLDFGCARSMEDGKSMTVLLKPGFAPVEQYMTRGQGPFTDVYALCATIYYCLTGTLPPEAPTRLNNTFDRQADPLLPLSTYDVHVAPELEQTLLWGLAIQPADRAQSMAELSGRIEAALDTEAWGGSTPDTFNPSVSGSTDEVPASDESDSPQGAGGSPSRFRVVLGKIAYFIALVAGVVLVQTIVRVILQRLAG